MPELLEINWQQTLEPALIVTALLPPQMYNVHAHRPHVISQYSKYSQE